MRHGAKSLDLVFKIADFFVLPTEYVAPDRVPRRAVVEPDRFRRREEHLRHHDLRRLVVLAANLTHPKRDPLVYDGVPTSDLQQWYIFNKKNHVRAREVTSVIKMTLTEHYLYISAIAREKRRIAIIDQRN